jgi:hypothetical protein
MAPVLEQFDRVGQRTSGDGHLMTLALEKIHQRPKHEHMSGVR